MNLVYYIIVCVGVLSINLESVTSHGLGQATTDDKSAQVPSVLDFGRYVEEFRKNYSPVETLVRAKVFFARTLNIFKHNVMFMSKKRNYFLEQNQFTDLTPEEIKAKFSMDLGLKLVEEARLETDLDSTEHYSMASLGSLTSKEKDPEVLSSDTVSNEPNALNFLENQEIENLQGLLKQLHSTDPQFIEKVSHVVELKDKSTNDKKAARKDKIVPIVESNNKNYDIELIPSQAPADPPSQRNDRYYTDFILDDYMISPYPLPEMLGSDDKDSFDRGWTIGDFVGSIKNIYDMVKSGVDKTLDEDIYDADYVMVPPAIGKVDEKEEIAIPTTPAPEINKEPSPAGKIKYNIDWRVKGCLTKPKSQADCNSCYAFAILDVMEFNYCRQTQELTQFSAQYVIDCGHKTNLMGCKGGKLGDVGRFIRSYGLELQAIYPYKAKEDTCPYDEKHDEEKKSGYMRPEVKLFEIKQVSAWTDWLRRSPLVVGINMPSDFLAYGGGLHDGKNCMDGLVHAMVLVGTGTQDGKPFWLLRNTFSDSWGEEGYVRLSKKAPKKCFYTAVYMKTKF